MEQLVLGFGEIGKAIKQVLNDNYSNVQSYDVRDGDAPVGKFDVLHVCFPFFTSFIDEVKNYSLKFETSLIIIHSTVPVGTAKLCGAVHSPCRGVHPNLYEGIKTFVKYFGCFDPKKTAQAVKIFTDCGVNCCAVANSETTEALKIWDTTMYGWNIMLEKEIYKWCENNGVDFNFVYTDANKTYNEGYAKLGKPHFQKYILKHVPGPFGGHCVVPNCKFLDSPIAKTVEFYNEHLTK